MEKLGVRAMRTFLVALFVVAAGFNLFAQVQLSQIQGTVTDSTGAAIPEATVKITNTATDLIRSVVTDTDGNYVIPDLPIGPYRMDVSKTGFSTYVQTGIVLQVATNPTIDISLKVGNVSEQVQVEANATLVESTATSVGTVMENQRILELPLNGRKATDLIQYTPGVIPQGVAGNGGYPGTQQYVIAGSQAYGIAYYLDGSVYNNPWDLANMPMPMPDALQEFKIETSTMTASNGIHAGGTIGGPVVRNKLFFFFGYQDTITRQDPQANTAATFVPTPAMLAGDWSGCPQLLTPLPAAVKSLFVNNQISPTLYDPATVK